MAYCNVIYSYQKLLLLIIFHNFIYSQSTIADKFKKIKDATVRVTIEGSDNMGTGFFISENGDILTCWHVIKSAIVHDTITNKNSFKKIFITDDSTTREVGIPIEFIQNMKLQKQAVAYDFCLLIPKEKIFTGGKFLTLGNCKSATEGQEVITCGYPIGIQQKFVSKGIISTKYVNHTNEIITNNIAEKIDRDEVLLDMTMNRGNSGGAILLLNDSDKYEVIGIADFIITPIGGQAEQLKDFFLKNTGIGIQGVDPNMAFAAFTEYLSKTSIGVSGCVSINHIKDALGIK